MSGKSSYAKSKLEANWTNYSNDAVEKVIEKLFTQNIEEFRYTSEELTSEEDDSQDSVIKKAWTDFINGYDYDDYSPDNFDRPSLIFKIIRELVLTNVASGVFLTVKCSYTNGYDVTSIKHVVYKTGLTDDGEHINIIEKEVTQMIDVLVDNDGNEIESFS